MGNDRNPEKEYATCAYAPLCDELRRKLLVRQLKQAQKMTPVGVMAAGLAHDFKNVLTTIRLHSDLIGLASPADAPYQHNLSYIREALSHASELLLRLAAFARPQSSRASSLRVDKEVSAMGRVLQGAVGESIELIVRAEACPPVRMDRVELQQMLLNCVLNARQAIRGKGQIVIEVRVTQIDSSLAQQFAPPLRAGSYVEVVIADSGRGISRQAAANAATPFHPTRSKSSWGLGLTVVHGCAVRAGGAVRIYRQKQGTCVSIAFPPARIRVRGDKKVRARKVIHADR